MFCKSIDRPTLTKNLKTFFEVYKMKLKKKNIYMDLYNFMERTFFSIKMSIY